MVNNIYNMTNEEIIKEFSKEIDANFSPKYQRSFEECRRNIELDFDEEWSKKHFKWFLKKRRQSKLRFKILRRHTQPIFTVLEDYIEDMWPSVINKSFDNFANIHDIALGEPNLFVEEERQCKDIQTHGTEPTKI